MPRTLETVQPTSRPGLVAVYTPADSVNGHSFLNSKQNAFLHIKNDNAGTIVATILTPQTVDSLALEDRTVSMPTGTEVFIGPFNNQTYGNGASGVYFDFDIDTDVTLAVIQLGLSV